MTCWTSQAASYTGVGLLVGRIWISSDLVKLFWRVFILFIIIWFDVGNNSSLWFWFVLTSVDALVGSALSAVAPPGTLVSAAVVLLCRFRSWNYRWVSFAFYLRICEKITRFWWFTNRPRLGVLNFVCLSVFLSASGLGCGFGLYAVLIYRVAYMCRKSPSLGGISPRSYEKLQFEVMSRCLAVWNWSPCNCCVCLA
jgi:hypothetical protein